MKKDYIKPEIHIDEVELENLMLVETSQDEFDPNEKNDGFIKDRDNEGDPSWGNLW